MHKLYIDTNIFLDWLADRKPHVVYAKQIFNHALNNEVKLYCSAITIADVTFIYSKLVKDKKVINKIILESLALVEVIPTTNHQLIQACVSDFTDLEDAFQYYTATNIKGLTAILTRNKKDFKHSKIKVLTAEEYLKNYWS